MRTKLVSSRLGTVAACLLLIAATSPASAQIKLGFQAREDRSRHGG
jgi:hypothetical protein